nr:MAG TPA: hypothetical protein [Caudoviricetes sp.]
MRFQTFDCSNLKYFNTLALYHTKIFTCQNQPFCFNTLSLYHAKAFHFSLIR